MRRTTALPLATGFVLLVLPILLAACGGSDRLSAAEYRGRLAAVEQQVDKATADVDRALKAASIDEIRAGLTRFAAAQQQAGDSLAELQVPEDAENANAQLALGAHHLAGEVRATVAKLSGTTDPEDALKLINSRLDSASGARELDQALGKLRKLGYTKTGQGE